MVMSWWLLLVIFLSLGWTFFSITKSWRIKIAKEYIAYIRNKHPEITIIRLNKNSLTLKFESGDEVEGFFENIYHSCANVNTTEARQTVYEKFITGLLEGPKNNEFISLATHGSKIMPRLAPRAILADLNKSGEAPCRSFAGTGLIITYVIDYPNSVAYISGKQLEELDITEDSLYQLAMTNLAQRFSEQVVFDVLEKKTISVIKTMDSYDATKILLLPQYLPEDAEIVALIPDRDTLAITTIPADGDWSGLKKLAGTAAGRPLFKFPLLVRRTGFTVIQ